MELHNQQRQVNLQGQEILEYRKQAKQEYDDQLKRISEMVPFISYFVIFVILSCWMSFNLFYWKLNMVTLLCYQIFHSSIIHVLLHGAKQHNKQI